LQYRVALYPMKSLYTLFSRYQCTKNPRWKRAGNSNKNNLDT
jgi:hypothetical protein